MVGRVDHPVRDPGENIIRPAVGRCSCLAQNSLLFISCSSVYVNMAPKQTFYNLTSLATMIAIGLLAVVVGFYPTIKHM